MSAGKSVRRSEIMSIVGIDSEPSREELAADNTVLRAELDRLSGLLGLDTRGSHGHQQMWEPTLFNNAVPAASVDRTSPAAEKVAMFASLFGSRSDVYAQRWENPTSGKSGWSPGVRGGWSANKKGRRRDYLPLTVDVFASHLRGEATIGVYPLQRGDTCALLACDFDGSGWALDALALLDACHDTQVPAVLERSRSGDGAHVWTFFESPVPASTARAMGWDCCAGR